MDTRWLEDFLALRETGNFTRAAERRYITQPAFSRRIRSLEDWLGVELIDRSSYPPKVNTLGENYATHISDCLQRLNDLRNEMRKEYSRQDGLLITTQASLSVSFCPALISQLRPAIEGARVELVAGNLYECMEEFLAGRSDLLVCYDSPAVNPMLTRGDLERLQLGSDSLIPVVAEQHRANLLPVSTEQAVPTIGYPAQSFFGQLIQQSLTAEPAQYDLSEPVQTAHADAARALMKSGVGVAWLPSGLVQEDLAAGSVQLVDTLPTIKLEIILLRLRDNRNVVANNAWLALAEGL